jgi:hypothetical protein
MEFSASVGFIDKESVRMHGHTIIKFISGDEWKWKLLVSFSAHDA